MPPSPLAGPATAAGQGRFSRNDKNGDTTDAQIPAFDGAQPDHAPRGAGHLEQYGSLRRGLAQRLSPAQRLLVGRVPADAVLPRAHHEVLLVGPAELTEALTPSLRASAEALTAVVACAGAFESPR